MPDHKLYKQINKWLFDTWIGRNDRIKRITTDVNIISKILSKSLFKKYETRY